MKNILIVDDDPDIRDSLATILSENYQVATASGKSEALKMLNAHDAPNLILLDVKMESHQDGFEFVGELSEAEKQRKIPIILITSTEAMTVSDAVAEIARTTREKYNQHDQGILVLRSVTGEVMVDYKSKLSGEKVTIKVDGFHPKPINPERLKKEIEFTLDKYDQ